jgi:hypothetical protein
MEGRKEVTVTFTKKQSWDLLAILASFKSHAWTKREKRMAEFLDSKIREKLLHAD